MQGNPWIRAGFPFVVQSHWNFMFRCVPFVTDARLWKAIKWFRCANNAISHTNTRFTSIDANVVTRARIGANSNANGTAPIVRLYCNSWPSGCFSAHRQGNKSRIHQRLRRGEWNAKENSRQKRNWRSAHFTEFRCERRLIETSIDFGTIVIWTMNRVPAIITRTVECSKSTSRPFAIIIVCDKSCSVQYFTHWASTPDHIRR